MEIAADLAMVFHFSLDTIDSLLVSELEVWHGLARERMKALYG